MPGSLLLQVGEHPGCGPWPPILQLVNAADPPERQEPWAQPTCPVSALPMWSGAVEHKVVSEIENNCVKTFIAIDRASCMSTFSFHFSSYCITALLRLTRPRSLSGCTREADIPGGRVDIPYLAFFAQFIPLVPN